MEKIDRLFKENDPSLLSVGLFSRPETVFDLGIVKQTLESRLMSRNITTFAAQISM